LVFRKESKAFKLDGADFLLVAKNIGTRTQEAST